MECGPSKKKRGVVNKEASVDLKQLERLGLAEEPGHWDGDSLGSSPPCSRGLAPCDNGDQLPDYLPPANWAEAMTTPHMEPVESTEVFMGGLGSTGCEEAIRSALPCALLPRLELVKVQVAREHGRCLGFAYLTFPSRADAQLACSSVREVDGSVVALHISRGRTAEELPTPAGGLPYDHAEGSHINQLLNRLRRPGDSTASVQAAMSAAYGKRQAGSPPAGLGVLAQVVPAKRQAVGDPSSSSPLKLGAAAACVAAASSAASVPFPFPPLLGGWVGEEGPAETETATAGSAAFCRQAGCEGEAAAGLPAPPGERQLAWGGADSARSLAAEGGGGGAAAAPALLAALLDRCPETRQALDSYRGSKPEAQLQSMTPLTILNQHANRMRVEVSYSEQADTPTGPFTVLAKIALPGTAAPMGHLSGVGKARIKKDAKQVAAAGILEQLLPLLRAQEEACAAAGPWAVRASSKKAGAATARGPGSAEAEEADAASSSSKTPAGAATAPASAVAAPKRSLPLPDRGDVLGGGKSGARRLAGRAGAAAQQPERHVRPHRLQREPCASAGQCLLWQDDSCEGGGYEEGKEAASRGGRSQSQRPQPGNADSSLRRSAGPVGAGAAGELASTSAAVTPVVPKQGVKQRLPPVEAPASGRRSLFAGPLPLAASPHTSSSRGVGCAVRGGSCGLKLPEGLCISGAIGKSQGNGRVLSGRPDRERQPLAPTHVLLGSLRPSQGWQGMSNESMWTDPPGAGGLSYLAGQVGATQPPGGSDGWGSGAHAGATTDVGSLGSQRKRQLDQQQQQQQAMAGLQVFPPSANSRRDATGEAAGRAVGGWDLPARTGLMGGGGHDVALGAPTAAAAAALSLPHEQVVQGLQIQLAQQSIAGHGSQGQLSAEPDRVQILQLLAGMQTQHGWRQAGFSGTVPHAAGLLGSAYPAGRGLEEDPLATSLCLPDWSLDAICCQPPNMQAMQAAGSFAPAPLSVLPVQQTHRQQQPASLGQRPQQQHQQQQAPISVQDVLADVQKLLQGAGITGGGGSGGAACWIHNTYLPAGGDGPLGSRLGQQGAGALVDNDNNNAFSPSAHQQASS